VRFLRRALRRNLTHRTLALGGLMHGQEIFSVSCPDVSADTAVSIAEFARTI
jgi:hypothetical protein